MGKHRRSRLHRLPAGSSVRKARRMRAYPRLPSNVGKTPSWKWADGTPERFTIVDEIRRRQSSARSKTIVLQKIRRASNGRIEFRLGYYMIGVKPRMAGKWTWGQYATLIPARDLKALITRARQREWI